MLIFLIFLLNKGPIRENFDKRNFWLVSTMWENAKDSEDSILVLISCRMSLKTKRALDFIKDDNNLSTDVRLAFTSVLLQSNQYDSIVVKNLKTLADSIGELKEYFYMRLTEKLLNLDEPEEALLYLKELKTTRYQRIALKSFVDYIWNKKKVEFADTLLALKSIGQETRIFLKALKALSNSDTINARNLAKELAKIKPDSPYALRLAWLIDDTLKAYVHYSCGNYKEADSIFSKIKTDRYAFAQIMSAYRRRNYEKTARIYEKLKNKLSEQERKNLLLQIGYSYWKTGKPIKGLEYLLFIANEDNEAAARLVTDILIKENSEIIEQYRKNVVARSQKLSYSLGLYHFFKNDTVGAETLFIKSLTGRDKRIAIRARYYLKELGRDNDNYPDEELKFDYFYILDRGFVITNEPEPEVPKEAFEKLKIFKYLLILGDQAEALYHVLPEPNVLYGAVKLAERYGNDYIRIKLALDYHSLIPEKNGTPLYLLKHIFPTNYYEQISTIANFYNVRPEIVIALMREESRFNPHAVSPAGAIGLMQVIPVTGKRILREATPDSLLIPDLNITIGIKYLSMLSDSFPNLIHTLCAYNAGESRIREWKNIYNTSNQLLFVELIPFRETREYVQRILRSIIIYQYLLRGEKK